MFVANRGRVDGGEEVRVSLFEFLIVRRDRALRVNNHRGPILFNEGRAHSLNRRVNLLVKLDQVGVNEQADRRLIGEEDREGDDRDLSVSAFRSAFASRLVGPFAFASVLLRVRFHR